MPNIIVLRGNSCCGKSTAAKILQQKMGSGTFLISQDYIRREMLCVKDRPNNQAIGLLEALVRYGSQNCDYTILEGILYTDIYSILFARIRELYGDNVFAYYFDIPFEETLKRHKSRPNAHEFGETEMKRWWRDKDFLTIITEKIIDRNMGANETVEHIYQDVMNPVL